MQVRILFFAVENNDKGPNVVVSYHVKIWKYKKKKSEVYTPNCSKEIFMIKKVGNIVLWTYLIEHSNGEEYFRNVS